MNTKIFSSLFAFIILIILSSCGKEDKSSPSGLAGKVFALSGGIDSACVSHPPTTDYFQTVLFLNDKDFVKLVSTCCPTDTNDFAAELFYKGTYTSDDKFLNLTYSPKKVVYYVRQGPFPEGGGMPNVTKHIETEENSIKASKHERLSCKEISYYKQLDGDFPNTFINPTKDSIEALKGPLEKRGIWEKIMEIKQD